MFEFHNSDEASWERYIPQILQTLTFNNKLKQLIDLIHFSQKPEHLSEPNINMESYIAIQYFKILIQKPVIVAIVN